MWYAAYHILHMIDSGLQKCMYQWNSSQELGDVGDDFLVAGDRFSVLVIKVQCSWHLLNVANLFNMINLLNCKINTGITCIAQDVKYTTQGKGNTKDLAGLLI